MTILSPVSLSPSNSQAGTLLTSLLSSLNMSMLMAYSYCWMRRWEAEDLSFLISLDNWKPQQLPPLSNDLCQNYIDWQQTAGLSERPRKRRVKDSLALWGGKRAETTVKLKLALLTVFNVQFSGIKCMPNAAQPPSPLSPDLCLHCLWNQSWLIWGVWELRKEAK